MNSEPVSNVAGIATKGEICFVTSDRISEGSIWGAEIVTGKLAAWLMSKGIEVSVIGKGLVLPVRINGSTLGVIKGPELKRGRVVRVPAIIYSLSLVLFAIALALRLIKENKEHHISLIHAQDLEYSGLGAAFAGRILRVPVIISSHGIYQQQMRYSVPPLPRYILTWAWWIERLVCRGASKLICLNQAGKEFLSSICSLEKMEVIPAAIDTGLFAPTDKEIARQALGLEKGEFIIGYVGRLSGEKNIPTLIHGFKLASADREDMKLIIVGDGIMTKQLKEICAGEGLASRITFVGLKREIPLWLSAFDIFVLPSLTEGTPLALIEAMACGKAIVASDIPSIREIALDSRSALLFNPQDAHELSDRIRTLYQDSVLRENLGSNARSRAQDFDLERVFPRILALYDEVRDRASPKG